MFEQDFENMLRKHQDIIDDKKKFSGLVKDYFPDNAKNMNLLLMAYNMGIADDMKNISAINNTFAFRYVKQLMDDFGLSRSNADWIVSVWCVCYGERVLRKPCDIKIQGKSTGPAIKEEQTVVSGNKYGDLFIYNNSSSGNGLTVAGFRGSKRQTIIFQNRYNGKNVIEIGDGTFKGEDIEEAILTDGIAYIGNSTFEDCKRLHQVVMPISIKEIGDSTFAGCTGLKALSLPDQLGSIGASAFKGSGLKTISIPKSVYYIGDYTFADCVDIDNMVMPANIDKITQGMFENCINLKSIQLSESVVAIEDRAFFGCENLAFIIIPDSVKHIGVDAFTETNKQFIISCSFGSYTEEYCRKNKIKYQLV